jgi:hypothetical protein
MKRNLKDCPVNYSVALVEEIKNLHIAGLNIVCNSLCEAE